MFRIILRDFAKNLIPKNNVSLGRWGSSNPEIKAALANMDCCGDSLCGKPENYNKVITNLIEKEKKIIFK